MYFVASFILLWTHCSDPKSIFKWVVWFSDALFVLIIYRLWLLSTCQIYSWQRLPHFLWPSSSTSWVFLFFCFVLLFYFLFCFWFCLFLGVFFCLSWFGFLLYRSFLVSLSTAGLNPWTDRVLVESPSLYLYHVRFSNFFLLQWQII